MRATSWSRMKHNTLSTPYKALRILVSANYSSEFGEALDFVWSPRASQDYAISTRDSKIKLFRNFQLHTEVKLNYSVR